MPRATCRCGQRLSFPADGPDRVICPKCQSRIRVRRPGGAAAPTSAAARDVGDGFIRFACVCGRRLKLRDATPRPDSGRCPDCGRVVPVPANLVPSARPADPEAPTADMDAADFEALDRWTETYQRKSRGAAVDEPGAPQAANGARPLAPTGSGGPGFALDPDSDDGAPGAPDVAEAPVKIEAGLRVCPRCGRPVHLGAEVCRHCGAHVPKR